MYTLLSSPLTFFHDLRQVCATPLLLLRRHTEPCNLLGHRTSIHGIGRSRRRRRRSSWHSSAKQGLRMSVRPSVLTLLNVSERVFPPSLSL